MATLTNTKIKDTYVGLLKTTDNQAIDAAGVTLVEDGAGNASALSVGRSGNGVTITGGLNATLSTAAQPNITSVGTLSSLAVSGNLTVDTNTLYVDAANNRVGIGTSSPAYKLDVRTISVGVSQSGAVRFGANDQYGMKLEQGSTVGGIPFANIVGPVDANAQLGFKMGASSTEVMRITPSGNVGIGTSSPAEKVHIEGNNSKLKITNTNTTSTGYHGIIFESLDTAGFTTQSLGQIDFVTSAGATGLSARIKAEMSNANGAGNIVFSAGAAGAASEIARITANGLTFNGDTADANALDDYEEGTWTPVYEPSTGTFATMTMEVLNAAYTKIGRLVTIVAQIRTDDVDVTGGSGNVLIGGLPYTAVLSSGGGGAISVGFTGGFVNAPTNGGFTNNGTTIVLRVGTTPMAVADLTDGTSANENTLYFAASYFTS